MDTSKFFANDETRVVKRDAERIMCETRY